MGVGEHIHRRQTCHPVTLVALEVPVTLTVGCTVRRQGGGRRTTSVERFCVCTAQWGSAKPRVATEHSKCGSQEAGAEFYILFHYKIFQRHAKVEQDSETLCTQFHCDQAHFPGPPGIILERTPHLTSLCIEILQCVTSKREALSLGEKNNQNTILSLKAE